MQASLIGLYVSIQSQATKALCVVLYGACYRVLCLLGLHAWQQCVVVIFLPCCDRGRLYPCICVSDMYLCHPCLLLDGRLTGAAQVSGMRPAAAPRSGVRARQLEDVTGLRRGLSVGDVDGCSGCCDAAVVARVPCTGAVRPELC